LSFLQCPRNAKGVFPKGGACHKCGSVQHRLKDCPQNPLNKNRPQEADGEDEDEENKYDAENEEVDDDNGGDEDVEAEVVKKARTSASGSSVDKTKKKKDGGDAQNSKGGDVESVEDDVDGNVALMDEEDLARKKNKNKAAGKKLTARERARGRRHKSSGGDDEDGDSAGASGKTGEQDAAPVTVKTKAKKVVSF
jgi:hypothetical protein